ncbi:Glycosyltransferase, catalytic subunit of cellulose synthase and poly-beta-1,6-N-acetylglucosamine synthase [Flaviramulus basaltis]|uniref:Glycosyltransferase, catalytic subunit of cellulose synthase and poly-beta-1,6-N-acetylglucosamine synthase n=1 Tax=Flaviramulus basaltis TaxID=369401 RepID=A0A1K2IAJ6_9FLAO|nr:glycosyltransferase [Flaviramulus basaltis]SFZ89423.1 Glycosyltransferase, catalytic subunit of cellulose synthase and poly-beta-1,6-N-acetylglucosamine synthase [Flaviramulus basaltis]
MILVSIIITVIYLLLIGSFVYGFDKVDNFKLDDITPTTRFSIIIPFRNEAENLPSLLKSIEALEYPKSLFEIILVDDDSEDNSVSIIKQFINNYQNISIILNDRKTNSPKKDAITTAIKKAENEWIITTDADCILPKYWLDSFDEYIQKTNTLCIVAPVTYSQQNHFLHRFQLLDILSLQGATIGGFGSNKPFLCNGANFAYKKELFDELNGFEGNNNIASGDDIFFLEKVSKTYPKQLHYLKCEQAIVTTNSQPTWKHLISQRIRWAAKTSAYNNWFGKLTGLTVLLMNSIIIISLLLSLMGVFKLKILLYIIIIKFNIDFFLIYKSANFFNQKEVLMSFFFGFIIYPFFSVYVAFISVFSNYKWKGRQFKK